MDGGDIGISLALRNPAHSAFRIVENTVRNSKFFPTSNPMGDLVLGCGSGDGQGRLEVPPRHGAQPGEVVDDSGTVLVVLVDSFTVRRRDRRRSGQKRHTAIPVRRLHF